MTNKNRTISHRARPREIGLPQRNRLRIPRGKHFTGQAENAEGFAMQSVNGEKQKERGNRKEERGLCVAKR